jgi:hypothetical protein
LVGKRGFEPPTQGDRLFHAPGVREDHRVYVFISAPSIRIQACYGLGNETSCSPAADALEWLACQRRRKTGTLTPSRRQHPVVPSEDRNTGVLCHCPRRSQRAYARFHLETNPMPDTSFGPEMVTQNSPLTTGSRRHPQGGRHPQTLPSANAQRYFCNRNAIGRCSDRTSLHVARTHQLPDDS